MKARYLLIALSIVCTLATGCRNSACCRRTPPPPSYSNGPGYSIPPAGIPVGPPRAAINEPIPGPPPGAGPAPAGNTELMLPQTPPPGKARSDYPPPPTDTSKPATVLGDPDFYSPPAVKEEDSKPSNRSAPPPEPPVAKSSPLAEQPVGIEEYTVVKEGVSAGLRPEIEGLDWLSKKGTKTVVYLRRESEDDTTDRRQVERRGMQFRSIVVSPQNLTQDFINNFNKDVGATGTRPIFIYSRDGAISSAVWYLHLRTAEFLTYEEARVRISRMGFKDENNEFFQAALKVMPKQ
jgi:protein tyrosine phosphatase (PTP) superfamily phosphohydrolase (DUF442 family)